MLKHVIEDCKQLFYINSASDLSELLWWPLLTDLMLNVNRLFYMYKTILDTNDVLKKIALGT